MQDAEVPEVVQGLISTASRLETAIPAEALVALGTSIRIRVGVANAGRIQVVRTYALRGTSVAEVAAETACPDSASASFLLNTDKHSCSAVEAQRRVGGKDSNCSSEQDEASSGTTRATRSDHRHC